MIVKNRFTDREIGEFNIVSAANLSGANLSAANLRGADLSAADLSAANLRGADLRGANLRGANLSAADLSAANLSGANLSAANLSGADLSGANLSAADLSGANLSAANLSGADLSAANLSAADLSGADLRGANLRGANLSAADLRGAKNCEYAIAITSILPDCGDVIGWKMFRNGAIGKLLITDGTPRSNSTGRKCRAKQVTTLEVIGAEFGLSLYDGITEYHVGQVTSCDEWNEDRWTECGGGIHFFITRYEAEHYN